MGQANGKMLRGATILGNGVPDVGGVPTIGGRAMRMTVSPDTERNLAELAKFYGWKSPVALGEKLLSTAIDRAVKETQIGVFLNGVMNLWANATLY